MMISLMNILIAGASAGRFSRRTPRPAMRADFDGNATRDDGREMAPTTA